MSTLSSTTVNAGDGLWISVSELARQKGVDKAAISRRIARLEVLGALEARIGARGTKLVNVAAYDRAVGQTGDAVRTMNGGGETQQPPMTGGKDTDPVLAREQARRTAYQADIAKLDLDERLKKLLPIDEVVIAVGTCAEGILRVIEKLPSRADEIASAVGKDGAQGARSMMKLIALDLRSALEQEMRNLADAGFSAALAAGEAEDAA